ncbi:esterase/lipase family protein [Parvibaculum sp.]|uniref:esterase/lipase family protein n=1 Tax=Parvibaculum sp. TaxID=2024848 RepID=UPI0034A09426
MVAAADAGAMGIGPRTKKRLRPPSRLLTFAEPRALLELGLGLASVPLLLRAPRGDGHPVVALPGFLAADGSTHMLRRYLDRMGYETHGWGLGRNIGSMMTRRHRLYEEVAALHKKTGRKVSLVGWSLGGIYARDVALEMPEAVRYVISLGSPFANDVRATHAGKLYEKLGGESVDDIAESDLIRIQSDLPMPATAIFTRTDGVVNWKTCVLRESDKAENIEVLGSHCGLGVNPAVLWAVADRLAQKEGAFKAFDRKGPFRLGYPRR